MQQTNLVAQKNKTHADRTLRKTNQRQDKQCSNNILQSEASEDEIDDLYSKEELKRDEKETKQKPRGHDRLEHLSREVFEKLLTSSKNVITRKNLIRSLKVCRRRIYDCLTISTSIGIFDQLNNNQYEYQNLRGLQELISLAQKNPTYIHDVFGEVEQAPGIRRLAINILIFLIHSKKQVTMAQLFKEMQCYFQSVKTRTRRIYDILNVFSAFFLVRKTKYTKSSGTTYSWKGLNELKEYSNRIKPEPHIKVKTQTPQQSNKPSEQFPYSPEISTLTPQSVYFQPIRFPLVSPYSFYHPFMIPVENINNANQNLHSFFLRY